MGEYRKAVVRAFPYTIPVLAGYLFIGAAFGVMFADQGYNVLWAILMSVVVYAGSGQYLATNFFVPGMSILQAVFLTVMVNIRHVFYGLSLVDRYNRFGKKRWYLIFGMTDETYSLICTTDVPDDVDEEKFLLSITLLNQLYWILGTIIEKFKGDNIKPLEVPGVLIKSHGVFAFGKDADGSVYNATVIEEVAKMAFITEQVNPKVQRADKFMMDKHYLRKHGKNAYYGQNRV